MNKKITYYDLLKMVVDGNPPETINVFGMTYRWTDDCAYINQSTGKFLMLYLGSCSEEVLTTWDIVEICEQSETPLTGDKKEFEMERH